MGTKSPSFLTYLLSTHPGPGAVLDSGDAKVNDTAAQKPQAVGRQTGGQAGGRDAARDTLIKAYPECHAATKIQLLSCPQGGRGLPRHRCVCWVQDRIKTERGEGEREWGAVGGTDGNAAGGECPRRTGATYRRAPVGQSP